MRLSERLGLQRQRDDGAIAVVVATFTVVMFAFAALVVDLGLVRDLRRQAQVVADVAALAGAGVLTSDGGSRGAAFAAARTKVVDNWPAGEAPLWSSCPPPTDGWVRWSGDASGTWCIVFHPTQDQVRVVSPTRTSPSFFGGLVGYSGAQVSASAEAGASDQRTGDPACVLCVIEDGRSQDDENEDDEDDDDEDDDSGSGSDSGGSYAVEVAAGRLDVVGGDVRVGGDLRIEGSGAVAVTGGTPRLRGQVSPRHRLGQVQPAPDERAEGEFGDPFAAAPVPSPSAPEKSNPCTQGPGEYEDDVDLTGSTTCTLAPGVYIVEDRWRVSGSARLTGTGVLLFFRGNGRLEVLGSAQVSLASPNALRVALAYDRSSSQDIRVEGTARLSVTGTVYAPRARLRLAGDAVATLRSLVVVRRVELAGRSRLAVTYSASENVPAPASTRRLPALYR